MNPIPRNAQFIFFGSLIKFDFRPAPTLEHRVREITATTRSRTDVLDFRATKMFLDSGISVSQRLDSQIGRVFIELPSWQWISRSNIENEAHKLILAFTTRRYSWPQVLDKRAYRRVGFGM